MAEPTKPVPESDAKAQTTPEPDSSKDKPVARSGVITALLSPFSKKPKDKQDKQQPAEIQPVKEEETAKENPPVKESPPAKENPPAKEKSPASKKPLVKEKLPAKEKPTPKDKKSKEKQPKVPSPKRSDKQALSSALTLRSLTFGLPKDSSATARSTLNQIKSDLLNPQLAIRVIFQLHALPAPSGPSTVNKDPTQPVLAPKEGDSATSVVYPIHAVSLDCTDEEADSLIFQKLPTGPGVAVLEEKGKDKSTLPSIPSVAYADIGHLLSTFKDVKVVNLLEAPDFGLGQPIDGVGILAGSVPDPQTISQGVAEITQQLMALGFATSNAVFPNHSGVFPPLDRMSVITYWWGMELVLPEPSINYLDKMTSVSHGVLNFLSAVAIVDNGVREILPFVRYISQFVDFEWSTIKAQDQGRGVVCASTWVMPAAMVPRPWDFPSPPPASASATTDTKTKEIQTKAK